MKKVIMDEIFKLNNEFISDQRKEKINGGIGLYLDDEGKPYVMSAVRKAVSILNLSNFNYLPISGDSIFLEESAKIVLGNYLYSNLKKNIIKQAVAGGTNGLFLWGSLIKIFNRKPLIIISNPSWENHKRIFSYLGFRIKEYKHLNEKGDFNFRAFKKIIIENPRVFLLLHGGSTHNPTGVNPDNKQWEEIVEIIKHNKNEICFDFAYMGLGNNIEKDSYSTRLFIRNNIPTSIVISYSKNMTLYQHRTGIFLRIENSIKKKTLAENHLQNIFRITNSNPPAFGQLIAKEIFTNDQLKNNWINSLKTMVKSIENRRRLFVDKTGDRFKFILKHKGLFSLLNLNPDYILKLKDKYGIYLLSNSRINFSGISIKNIEKTAKAINELIL